MAMLARERVATIEMGIIWRVPNLRAFPFFPRFIQSQHPQTSREVHEKKLWYRTLVEKCQKDNFLRFKHKWLTEFDEGPQLEVLKEAAL